MSRDALIGWLERNRPDLDRALMHASRDDMRVMLNEATGLKVAPCDGLHDSCAAYLAALIEISKQTPPGAADNRRASAT